MCVCTVFTKCPSSAGNKHSVRCDVLRQGARVRSQYAGTEVLLRAPASSVGTSSLAEDDVELHSAQEVSLVDGGTASVRHQ